MRGFDCLSYGANKSNTGKRTSFKISKSSVRCKHTFCALLVTESLDDTVLVFHTLPHFNQLVCAEQKITPGLK